MSKKYLAVIAAYSLGWIGGNNYSLSHYYVAGATGVALLLIIFWRGVKKKDTTNVKTV